jgi:hypothetical protein
VKVLDFGLAKALDGAGAAAATGLPTLTGAERMIVGTPAYMSPEQARGGAVDRRTDVWAFGCVLFEMLAGRRAFDGATSSDAIAAVLTRDPDWSALPADLPYGIGRLLRRCLEKDTKQRLRDIADAHEHLRDDGRDELAPAVGEPAPRRRPIARVASIAAPDHVDRRIRDPRDHSFSRSASARIAIADRDAADNGTTEFRAVAGRALHRLRGVGERHGAAHVVPPRTGRHGRATNRWYRRRGITVLVARQQVDRFSSPRRSSFVLTAPAVRHSRWPPRPPRRAAPGAPTEPSCFHQTLSALCCACPASGGKVVAATTLDSPHQKNHRSPFFLPDGHRFLYSVEGETEVAGIYLGSLDGGAPKRLSPADSAAMFLPPDRVIFMQDGALVARELDASRDELIGDPVTLAASIGSNARTPVAFSTSATGVVAYRAAAVRKCVQPGSIALGECWSSSGT